MKKVVFLCLIILFNFNSLYAQEDISSIDVALDIAYFDPLIDNKVYNEVLFSFNINDELSLRIPINLIFPTSSQIDLIGVGSSIDVLYRPFFNGFCITFSLVKFEYLYGYDAPYENLQYLNKLNFGYTFKINEKIYIEPSISFFNLNGIYDDSIQVLIESFGGFSSVRPSILIGYKIMTLQNNKEER